MGALNTLKDVVNFLTNPPIFITLMAVTFFLLIGRRAFWRPRIGLVVGVVAAIFVALSTLDPNFRLIVGKPDNIPIVAMLFLVGFFFFLSMSQAYSNDERIARGELPIEATPKEAEKTWVWPDLVYTELLCMVIAVIREASIGVQKPRRRCSFRRLVDTAIDFVTQSVVHG